MPSHFKLTLLLLLLFILLILIAPESAGICKWVDKEGVVHYAEHCPEDTHSTEIQIEAPPTQDQLEEAARRSESMVTGTRIYSEKKAQGEKQKTLEEQQQKDTSDRMIKNCADARWKLEILRKPLPVYFDDKNELHFNRSLHDRMYEGQRTYLDDQQRQEKIMHYTQLEEKNCTSSEADIRERIGIYRENVLRDECLNLRNRLENMQKTNTGIPSDEMRDLQKLIDTWCN